MKSRRIMIFIILKISDNFDGDLTTCMSSPAYDTITDALKLEQFGHEDGDVVQSGTRVLNLLKK